MGMGQTIFKRLEHAQLHGRVATSVEAEVYMPLLLV